MPFIYSTINPVSMLFTRINRNMGRIILITVFSCCILNAAHSQGRNKKNLVYVDPQGVIRYTDNNKEASFFGVNYTVPFAYGYRSHQALAIDHEKAIDADVHHMARMGLDAFRVHVWDVEISDSTGKLLDNAHLRLFDYLVKKLQEKNIKMLITPIAFWGNGYPEPDVKTNGFSYVYGKRPAVVNEAAFKAQENFLRQFFTHVNPYTKKAYKDDRFIIAMEINNEPQHSGSKERVTEYVNRMTAAVRSTGWDKPIFYNISESPTYADAVVAANVDGHSFQWYPSGLVAGHEIRGNFLPHVDVYNIPFDDTISRFRSRAKMVYEFDAADIMQPYMYPAMARSYRTAGFQWATQFAYDPMSTAYANTEYQTHYLNLAYTPSKAISMLIASRVFLRLPRNKTYGVYPADTLFDVFRVSYLNQLSEMNSEEEFYYSNSTSTKPKDLKKLKHIAGTGNSGLVSYDGTGAYFLDKSREGEWLLEIMPDAIPVHDPFEKASLTKKVTVIKWKRHRMDLKLPDLGNGFFIEALNEDNKKIFKDANANGQTIVVGPGIYRLINKNQTSYQKLATLSPVYFAPADDNEGVYVFHQPVHSVSAGSSFRIQSKITGIDSSAKIVLELRNASNKWRTVPMKAQNIYDYYGDIPVDFVTPGILLYRILIYGGKDSLAFPGGFRGNPYAWNEYRYESWETMVAAENSFIEIFNPAVDRKHVILYNPEWNKNSFEYVSAGLFNQLVLKAAMKEPVAGQLMGWQYFFGDKIKGRISEVSNKSVIVIRARASRSVTAKISLITNLADCYTAGISIDQEWKDIEIPISKLVKDAMLLLPRPYPHFHPLWFTSSGNRSLDIREAEKLQFLYTASDSSPVSLELASVWLR